MELPPAVFFKLPCLKWLDVRDNRLRYIPSEIGQHNSLEVLLLDGNLISHLPFEIGEYLNYTGSVLYAIAPPTYW
jgi:Leucine-rich repeat (LRR) protein